VGLSEKSVALDRAARRFHQHQGRAPIRRELVPLAIHGRPCRGYCLPSQEQNRDPFQQPDPKYVEHFRLRLLGDPNRTHASFVDGFEQLVPPGHDGSWLHLAGNIHCGLLPFRCSRRLQKLDRLRVGCQKLIHLLPQSWSVSANIIKTGGASLGCRSFQRTEKYRLDLGLSGVTREREVGEQIARTLSNN